MDSSKGHLSKRDSRFQTEVFVPVVNFNWVREGELKPRKSVQR